MKWRDAVALIVVSVVCPPVLSCSICGGDFRNRPTIRQGVQSAQVVVFAKFANAKLDPDPLAGTGSTDLNIEQVLKGADQARIGAVVRIHRFYATDAKGPTHALAFFEVRGGKLDLVSIRTTNGSAIAKYAAELLALPAGNVPRLLDYCHRQLDNPDPDVAADAFLELTRGSDADVARAAKTFDAQRLRRLLTDPKTPAERLGFIGFLLGCSGGERDAGFLLKLMKQHGAKSPSALRGMMAGYVCLRPKDGWKRSLDVIADPTRGFLERHAILGMAEFFWNWKQTDHRDSLMLAVKAGVVQGDLADIAVEDLRRWKCWDLTRDVLSVYSRMSHDSEIVRRAILRYALTCPRPEASRFVAEQKKRTPDLVAEVEEALREEKSSK